MDLAAPAQADWCPPWSEHPLQWQWRSTHASWAHARFEVRHVRLSEAVHDARPLWAEVLCRSPQAHLPVAAWVGQDVRLALRQPDGHWRVWLGRVHRAANEGEAGGLFAHRFTVSAWVQALQGPPRRRVFRHQRAADIVQTVLSACEQACCVWRVADRGPLRALTTQHLETDWDFAQRVMADQGWSWRMVHPGSPDEPLLRQEADADVEPGHTSPLDRACLLITDRHAMPPVALWEDRSSGRVPRVGEGHEWEWQEGQQWVTQQLTLGSWDERLLAGVSAHAERAVPQGWPEVSVYHGHGERRFEDAAQPHAMGAARQVAQSCAEVGLAAQTLRQRWIKGHSPDRSLRPGSVHTRMGSGQASGLDQNGPFRVLRVVHEMGLASDGQGRVGYRNHFEAVPADVPVVPVALARPRAPGLHLATVLSPPGQPVCSDRDGRVCIRFDWEAQAQGQDQTLDGSWVRVSQRWAGADWGAVFTPRAASRVLVEFIDGDIDRPVVLGQVHEVRDGAQAPSWPHGPTASGWHHAHLDQGGSNQWILDDSPGRVSMRLRSHRVAGRWHELRLGHLASPATSGDADPRVTQAQQGFVLHTQVWSVMRAVQGLLLSTCLDALQGQPEGVPPSSAAQSVCAAVRLQARGQVCWRSGLQLVVFSGADTVVSVRGRLRGQSGQHVRWACGQRGEWVAKSGGLSATAEQGALRVRAHRGALSLAAHDGIQVRSREGRVHIQARESITLSAGACRITLQGPHITFTCPGPWTAQASTHDWAPPSGHSVSLPPWPLPADPAVPMAEQAPSLALDRFSQAVDASSLPWSCLPFGMPPDEARASTQITSFDPDGHVTQSRLHPESARTPSVLTAQAQPLRHAVQWGSAWGVEEHLVSPHG